MQTLTKSVHVPREINHKKRQQRIQEKTETEADRRETTNAQVPDLETKQSRERWRGVKKNKTNRLFGHREN